MSEIKKALEEKYPVPEKLLPENIGKLIDDKKAFKKRKKIKIFTAVTSVAACCAIAVGVGVSSLDSKGPEANWGKVTTTVPATITEVQKEELVEESFSSYDDIFRELSCLYEEVLNSDMGFDMEIAVDENTVEDSLNSSNSLQGEASAGATDSEDFYETYEQVEGVSEADVIKTDGKFIYYLSNRMIYVINTDGEILCKTEIASSYYYNCEMYLKGDRIIITYMQSDKTYAEVYSVSEEGKLTNESSYNQSGSLCTSRLIDDKLYLVSYYYMYNMEGAEVDTPETFVPEYSINGEDYIVDADCIFLNDTQSFNGYTVISGIDIYNAEEAISVKSVFGSYPQIYCSLDNIYLMSNFTEYSKDYSFNLSQVFYSDYKFSKSCYITKLSIKDGDIGEVSRAVIEGNILNQFSADEYEGYLRIAVNRLNDNALYVLDENLEQIGFVDGMGIYEQIKSVTFDGETGYIVTFRQTDPLYTIDLSDPENPVITDELKISGFSTHLRQYNDGLMIGFGYEANVNSGSTTGLKLSMFEKDENGGQVEISKVVISENEIYYYIYSPATSDHKYLLIDSEKNIIGFPYTAYGEYIVDGDIGEYYDTTRYSYMYAIYSYTENGFELLNSIEVSSSEARAIYIDDTIYIFSENNLYLAKMETGEVIKEITLS